MDNVVQTGEDISNNNNNNNKNNSVNVNLTNNKKNLDTIYSLFEPLKKTNLELKEEINVLEKKIKEISENNKCSICLTNEKKYIFRRFFLGNGSTFQSVPYHLFTCLINVFRSKPFVYELK